MSGAWPTRLMLGLGLVGGLAIAAGAGWRLLAGPSDAPDWLMLVVLPGLAAVLSAVGLREPAWERPIAAMLTGAAVMLVLAELLLAAFNVGTLLASRSRQPEPAKPDRRSVAEGIAELRRDGIAALSFDTGDPVAIPGAPGPLVPLSGPADRTIVYCNENGYLLTYRTDERGFHNPPGLWSGPLDMAVLGDSFVHGACVPPEQNLVSRLRTRFPRTLNLGIGGSGPLIELARLREYALDGRARRMLWVFHANDLAFDLAKELVTAPLRHYLAPGARFGLAAQQPVIDAAAEAAAAAALAGRAVPTWPPEQGTWAQQATDSLRLRDLRLALGLDLSGRTIDWAAFEQILAMAARESEAAGSEFWFVYLGDVTEVNYARLLPRDSYMRRRVLEIVGRLGLRLIDTVPALRAQPHPLLAWPNLGPGRFPAAGHMTPAGYAIAAEAILAGLGAPRTAP